MRTLRIGAGAGYAGDRIDPAVQLARDGALDYLVFECLAERTIALAQLARMRDPGAGFDPLLEARMRAVLPACRARGTRIITNMGAANPRAAARSVAAVARALGLDGLRVAAVSGDDVLAEVRGLDAPLLETAGRVADLDDRMVSANAYLGAFPIIEALAAGADVVVTGRVGDPSMFLAAIAHSFAWSETDWDRLGQGTVVGHLLECAGQITGGYFADPGSKDVAGLARLGFPLAEVAEDGSAVITKVPGSGGLVSVATCKEQLLYEVHDPRLYLQPDVVADFSQVRLVPDAPDRVRVSGGRGSARTDTLKVSIGYRDGVMGEAEISYAGAGAAARARLARDILTERFAMLGARFDALRFDLIGLDAVRRGAATDRREAEPPELRLRVAARAADAATAGLVGREVEALYTNGPAGGGGVRHSVREVVAIASTLIGRDRVRPTCAWELA